MVRRNKILWAALLGLLLTTPAMAADLTPLGTFGSWKTFSYTENGSKTCFMSATPTKAEGKYTKRGEIFAMITHRPGEHAMDVFSYLAGYSYKDKAEVSISIDGKKYILYGQGENAWTPSDDQDKTLAQAIQKGSTMVVEGQSARGTKTKDTFSLSGSGSAYDAISKACPK